MVNKLWTIILTIFGIFTGGIAGEALDDQIYIPVFEKDIRLSETLECPTAVIIAYTDSEKFICECIGADCPCRSTEEILSELG